MTDLIRYKKPPAEIPRALLKKQELTSREKAWVHNDLIGAAIGAVLLIVGLWYVLLPLTMQWLGIATLTIGTLLMLERMAEWFVRGVSSQKSPLGNGFGKRKKLTHKARAELVLMDRNRRARVHNSEYAYGKNHYSCWPAWVDGQGVSIMLLEHERAPWWCPYWDVRVARHNGKSAIQELGKKPTPDALREAVESLEDAADAMEKVPHLDKVAEYEGLASVLDLRR